MEGRKEYENMSENRVCTSEPKFEFYVLNYGHNHKKIINFNIFNSVSVYEATLREVKQYCRNPKKYSYSPLFDNGESQTIYGFDAFCKRLDGIIAWKEWGRVEYEISVGDLFERDLNKYEKWDCYMQAKPNIEIIAREVIYQYKKYKKEVKRGKI